MVFVFPVFSPNPTVQLELIHRIRRFIEFMDSDEEKSMIRQKEMEDKEAAKAAIQPARGAKPWQCCQTMAM